MWRVGILCSVLIGASCERPHRTADDPDSAAVARPGATPGFSQEAGDSPTADSLPTADPVSAAGGVRRVVMVDSRHPDFERLEGTDFPNDCKQDVDCKVGGCSQEVCSAQEGVMTTCDVLSVDWPAGRSCGCVTRACVWWHPTAALPLPRPVKTPASGTDDDPARDTRAGERCGKTTCKAPESCIEYFGIAGPSGPAFRECAIRCKPGRPASCPDGMDCVTIADGPGPICRPVR